MTKAPSHPKVRHAWATPALGAVVILALGHTLVDLYVTTITPLLPRFVQTWNLSPASLGALAAATAITGSLLQPLLGFYLDRKGSSALAAIGLLWTAATVVVIRWVPSFIALFALATVTVFGSAIYHPLGAALTRSVAPSDRRGLYMSIFMNVGNIGWASAPLLVTAMVSAWGFPSLSWLSLPGLAGAAALLGLGLTLNGRTAATPSPVQAAPPVSGAAMLASRKERHRGVIFLVVATILRSWVASGVQTYLPTHLVQQGHSLTFAGGALSTFIMAGTVAGFIFGYLSDRWGRRVPFAGSLVLAAIGLGWYLYSPAAWSGVAIALAGAALLGSLPVSVVMVHEMLPNHTGVGSGLVMGFAGGLGGLLVLGSGFLAAKLGLGTALFWLIPALPIAALFVLAIPEASLRQTHSAAPRTGRQAG